MVDDANQSIYFVIQVLISGLPMRLLGHVAKNISKVMRSESQFNQSFANFQQRRTVAFCDYNISRRPTCLKFELILALSRDITWRILVNKKTSSFDCCVSMLLL